MASNYIDPAFQIGMMLGDAYGNMWAANAKKRQGAKADDIIEQMQNQRAIQRIADARRAGISDEDAVQVITNKIAQQAGAQGATQATGMGQLNQPGIDFMGMGAQMAEPQDPYKLSVPSPLDQLKGAGGKEYSINKALQANQNALNKEKEAQTVLASNPTAQAAYNWNPDYTEDNVRKALRKAGLAKDVIDEKVGEVKSDIAKRAREVYQSGILKDLYYGADVAGADGKMVHVPPNAATMASAFAKIQEYAQYDPEGAKLLASGIISPQAFYQSEEEERKYKRNRKDKLEDVKSDHEFQLQLENQREKNWYGKQQYLYKVKRDTLIRGLRSMYPNATQQQLENAADAYLSGVVIGGGGTSKKKSDGESSGATKTEYGGTKYKMAVEEAKEIESTPEEERTPEQKQRLKTLQAYIRRTGEEAIPSAPTQKAGSDFVGGLLSKGYTPSQILGASGYEPGSEQFNTLYDTILSHSGSAASGSVSPDKEFEMPTSSPTRATSTAANTTDGYPAPINYAYDGTPDMVTPTSTPSAAMLGSLNSNYPAPINYAYNGDPADASMLKSELPNYPAPINYAYNGDPADASMLKSELPNYPAPINYAYDGNPPDTSSSLPAKKEWGISDLLTPEYWHEFAKEFEPKKAEAYGGSGGSYDADLYDAAVKIATSPTFDNAIANIAKASNKPSGSTALTEYYADILNRVGYENNEGFMGIHYGSSGLVNRMRDACGIIPYRDSDGTNCARTIGAVLDGTPYAGFYNVDQFVDAAKKRGQLYTADSGYKPQAGDLAVTNSGNHIVMVTENGGTIQNGESHNGVYEVSASPQKANGNVQYYIRTSDYEEQFPNFHFDSGLSNYDIAGAAAILEKYLM